MHEHWTHLLGETSPAAGSWKVVQETACLNVVVRHELREMFCPKREEIFFRRRHRLTPFDPTSRNLLRSVGRSRSTRDTCLLSQAIIIDLICRRKHRPTTLETTEEEEGGEDLPEQDEDDGALSSDLDQQRCTGLIALLI